MVQEHIRIRKGKFMNQRMKRVCSLRVVAGAGLLVAMALAAYAQADNPPANAQDAGWPMYHQNGDYVAPKLGLKLVDKAEDMRLVFNGPKHMGVGKTRNAGYNKAKVADPLGISAFIGGTTTPIIANGMLYHSYFRGSGDVVDADYRGPHGYQAIAADDVVTAIDAETGKIKWEAVEEGKGVNRGGRKRTHWGVSPAYADGMVYAMGSTGRLYAYEAKTGEKKWESNIGAAHEKTEKDKAAALKKKKRYEGDSWKVNLVVADGVLVATDGWDGLVGFDIATGDRTWHAPKVISRWATPAIWRHDDREYLLVCTTSGELRLLDPKDGKPLWKETIGTNYGTIVLQGDIAICNVKQVGKERSEGVYGGIRITAKGIERLWSLPEKVETITNFGGADNAASRWVAIRDDIAVLCRKTTPRSGLSKYDIHIMAIEPRTGKILYNRLVTEENAPETASKRIRMPIFMEDHLLLPTDQNHGDSGYGAYYYRIVRDEDGKFKTLDYAGAWPKRHHALSGYETPIEIPYVAGRLYFRSMKGIACYDLRKKGK